MEYKKKRKQTSSVLENKNYHTQNKSPQICKIVNNIFKKSFTIVGNEKYTLPSPESMFIENFWEIEELQKIKIDLNRIKSKLNNYGLTQWHRHTSQRNKARDVEWRIRRDIDPEFVTQAWCKFHEIISKYPLVPKENIFANNNKFVSIHLCEAPGAFVTCLNHWLKTNLPTVYWDWLAMTYNPHYEGNSNLQMINDDRFIIFTLKNWFFGKDNTGNLMVLENLDALIEKVKLIGKVNLVTADGSVNCTYNPGEQEIILTNLHFCETVAALHILETSGNFLLKIFTIFENHTVCLIYFLSCVFNKIHFYKPVTSKEGNSEIYVICLNYKGLEFVSPYLSILKKEYGIIPSTAMFKRFDIPNSFVQQIISCAQFFKNYQCEVIENNIIAYDQNQESSEYNYNQKIAKLVAEKFMLDFPLQKLHVNLQIVGNLRLKQLKNNNLWILKPVSESFNDRQIKQHLEPINYLLIYVEQLKHLEMITETLIFKPSNPYLDTHIVTGKPYHYIQSSRFCTVEISEIYKLFFQVIDTEKNVELHLPSKEKILDFETKMQEFQDSPFKFIYFKYTDIYNNNQTIDKFKQILRNLQKGDNLVVIGFLLLTQFNVGLIYFLTHTFEHVEFTMNEQIGCTITFKNYKNKESILQKLDEIDKSAKVAVANNAIILSIISMKELYGSELYSIVAKHNHWLIKFCVNYIASIYNS